MTKEELKQEAEKYINNKQKPLTKYDLVAFAEPREKEIKILGERCLQLQKDKGKLIDENNELKAQIEKMKSDVMANIKWADKNCDNMWQKLVKMWNQWEIKENE